MITKEQLDNYFKTQKTYLGFLKEKLGDSFDENNNRVLTYGSYHDAWDHLCNIEDRLCIRTIVSALMKKNVVNTEFRNGSSYMKGVIYTGWFPKMQILKYLNNSSYGREDLNSKIDFWNCNEIIKAW